MSENNTQLALQLDQQVEQAEAAVTNTVIRIDYLIAERQRIRDEIKVARAEKRSRDKTLKKTLAERKELMRQIDSGARGETVRDHVATQRSAIRKYIHREVVSMAKACEDRIKVIYNALYDDLLTRTGLDVAVEKVAGNYDSKLEVVEKHGCLKELRSCLVDFARAELSAA